MEAWVAVAIGGLFSGMFPVVVEHVFRERERAESLRKALNESRHLDEEKQLEVLRNATTEMNKMLVRRLLLMLPFLILIGWVLSLGTITTPLGEMGAIWWYVITNLGGVAVATAISKAVKKD